MNQQILILGATGRFGRHAATALAAHGYTCRSFDRRRDDLQQAVRGADIVVNAWNPPYPLWRREVPAFTRALIDAVRGTRTRVVIPGNVYNFGEPLREPAVTGAAGRVGRVAIWDAGSAQRATNPLGRVRIEMEQAYRHAGVRTLILRCGDFLDTEASGNWFDRVMTRDLAKGRFSYPGDPAAAHAWAYLPDVGRALAGLLAREQDLDDFADIAFAGYTLTGHELAAAVGAVLGRPIALRRMAWWPVRLAQPFWPLAGHLLEMRYLWSLPHRLDGSALARALPAYRDTPLGEALAQCLPLNLALARTGFAA
ncbi:MAG: hypothetical protein R3E83_09340 [Burkholderiaceae bacterium]